MNEVEQVLSGKLIREPNFLSSIAVSHLRELGKEEEAEINNLDNEIRALQNCLNARTSKLALIKHALAPVRTLPLEIISLIFQHYVQYRVYHDWELNSRYYKYLPPAVLLSHVCSAWRRILLHLPSIWTYIPVYAIPSRQALPERDILASWLSHSDPLCVDVNINSHSTENFLEFTFPSYLDCLLPSSARWRCLNLSIPSRFLQHLLARPAISAPNLERLSINTTDEIPPHSSLSALKTAPKLREVKLMAQDTQRDNFWSAFGFPVHQITTLTLSGDPDILRGAMEECPRLEECSVCVPDYEVLPHFPAPRELSNLKLFSMFFDGPQGSPCFLGAFTMPQLTDLRLSHHPQPDSGVDIWDRYEVVTHLMSLHARSNFPLRTVSLPWSGPRSVSY
ncbi:hypothetical protein VKT23_007483 [Stygiomarasmius scandens]|uniref:F-box domain-containing protein n=1 Tax=Marasmiellus scandens TaxID=2682957 RepID=A0ABR1JMI6_9AGAR